MFTSGSDEMLKIIIEIIVQVFMTTVFLAFLFYLFFWLDKNRPLLYGFNGRILRLWKKVCVRLFVF